MFHRRSATPIEPPNMGLLIAFFAGVALTLLLTRRRTAVATPQSSPEFSTSRLQGLASPLSTAAEASGHPRDLMTNDTFQEAVALLKSEDAPLNIVMDYAIGANYAFATVACAALAD